MGSGKIWISNSLRLDHTKPKASKSTATYLYTHHTRSSSKLSREENITIFLHHTFNNTERRSKDKVRHE